MEETLEVDTTGWLACNDCLKSKNLKQKHFDYQKWIKFKKQILKFRNYKKPQTTSFE